MTANEQPSPGMLKVLLGAIRVIVLAATFGASVAMGTWRLSWSKTKPAWISSEPIIRSCRLATAANCDSSVVDQTRPTGL